MFVTGRLADCCVAPWKTSNNHCWAAKAAFLNLMARCAATFALQAALLQYSYLMQIGPYKLSSPFVLAPMAGVTDKPFRALCRRFGAGMTTS